MAVPSELLAELRSALGDPTTDEVTDDQLTTMLERALRELNRYKPEEGSSTISLVSGTSLYALPTGVARIRKLLYLEVRAPSSTLEDDTIHYGDDSSISRDLAGLSPSSNWVESLEHRQRDYRNLRLWGGHWTVEAGKIVVSPPPSCDEDVLAIHPVNRDFVDVDWLDLDELRTDLLTYAEYLGWKKLAAKRGRIAEVRRIGQATRFNTATNEKQFADDALKQWIARVGGKKPRIGPQRG